MKVKVIWLLLCLTAKLTLSQMIPEINEEEIGVENELEDRTKLKVHVVVHSHMDAGWLKTVDEY